MDCKTKVLSLCLIAILSQISYAKRGYYQNNHTNQSNNHCQMGETPEVIHPIENYNLTAGHEATIKTASSFGGIDLSYDVSAQGKYQNSVKINSKTGALHIRGSVADNFVVMVTAMNYCGTATLTFNVTVN